MNLKISAAALAVATFCAPAANAVAVGDSTFAVPGRSNPWLSGMPDGATASYGDAAPTYSPAFASGLDLSKPLTFIVSGSVSFAGGTPYAPPDGTDTINHYPGAQNGIADLSAPIDSLVGVFLTDAQPDGFAAPAALDFGDAASRDFLSLSPELQQPFFIGDGLTSEGVRQIFMAPSGATRLFLGAMDGYGWYNNTGEFAVTVPSGAPIIDDGGDPGAAVVPLPASILLLPLGFAALGALRRRA